MKAVLAVILTILEVVGGIAVSGGIIVFGPHWIGSMFGKLLKIYTPHDSVGHFGAWILGLILSVAATCLIIGIGNMIIAASPDLLRLSKYNYRQLNKVNLKPIKEVWEEATKEE